MIVVATALELYFIQDGSQDFDAGVGEAGAGFFDHLLRSFLAADDHHDPVYHLRQQ